MKANITAKPFGSFEGKPVNEYTLTNEHGMEVSVINYGATVIAIRTPDRNNIIGNVTLGFDSMEGYIQNGNQYMGSIVGRFCNRIGNAAFTLDGNEYKLAANDHNNTLHGGIKGFDKMLWEVEEKDERHLTFSYVSVDGDEGFPGNLKIEVSYTLTPQNELKIEYTAATDKATPVNFTSHSYFNLSAGKSKDILDHDLMIFADHYTAVDNACVPTGELLPVKDGPLDFTVAKKVGRDIKQLPNGYDMNYVLRSGAEKAAVLYDPASGRVMEVYTTEPGLQFYSGNFLPAPKSEFDAGHHHAHSALCLEAQHFPNSPNISSFPNCILRPGETYRQTTVYKFSTR